MSKKDEVVLVAGTVYEHQDVDGNWYRIPKITTTGDVGEMSEPKEKTTVEDDQKVYGSGLRDAPDKNLSGQYIPPQKAGDEFTAMELYSDVVAYAKLGEDTFPNVTDEKGVLTGGSLVNGTAEDFKDIPTE